MLFVFPPAATSCPITVTPLPSGAKLVQNGSHAQVLSLEQARLLAAELVRSYPDATGVRGCWRVEWWEDGRVRQHWCHEFADALALICLHSGKGVDLHHEGVPTGS